MADFNIAFDKVKAKQGGYSPNVEENQNDNEVLLCSNCFRDEGLRINAMMIGIEDNQECAICHSISGHKLTKALVRRLCYTFFVRGTIQKFEFGGCPLIQFNEQHFNKSEIDISPWLVNDVKLIEQAGEIGLFYYSPRFWMFGEVEPLKELQNAIERSKIIGNILTRYPVRELTEKEYFYRLRSNPLIAHDNAEYDTAPDNYLGKGRFDDIGFPVLYGSPDLELCVHECRVTVEDNLFVGKLVPSQLLKVLDLSALIEEDVTEFESLDMAIHFLFLAGKHSYSICREIAIKAKEMGFDGIIYPSYFSYIRTGAIPFDTILGISIRRFPQLKDYAKAQSIPNLALFGRPILENKVNVECINKLNINKVSYDISFGPAYHEAILEDSTSLRESLTKHFDEELRRVFSGLSLDGNE